MNRISISLAALALLSSGQMSALEIAGPDGRLVVNVEVRDGHPVYSLTYDGKTLLSQSPLGLTTDAGDFSSALTMTSDTTDVFHADFRQDRIKHSQVDFTATRNRQSYVNSDGQRLDMEWLVGNNDVAFRYFLPAQGGRASAVVKTEATGFGFPSHTTTFITPQSDPMIGWKRSKPSYEEPYTLDAPMTQPSLYGRGYTFPALFRVGDDGWVLVSETGVDGGYCGSRLGEFDGNGYKIEYPMEGENNGLGASTPGIALPGATPWRTITVGSTLAPIVETVIPWAPIEPLYNADVKAIGRGTWSWLIWQDASINAADQRAFIDLAADLGYDHALIDAGWDVNIGREGIEELARYARSRGTNIALWYSSSGWWNDITQSPVNLMSRPIPRKREMAWLKSIGVKTIKVDFFGGDKQETMRLYEDILSDAADYGISVIFHGCTLPRGWERLYPNYVGSEAVLASENLVFSQDFCDGEATAATLHPFIRNTVGSMEYGGTVLNRRLGRNDNPRATERRTSDVFQLATAVLFQNPVQNFALTPEACGYAAPEAIEFMKSVPTQWDETRYIDGYPGRYAVIARRSGNRWYIAGVNATGETLKLSLALPMLKAGAPVRIYTDAVDKPLSRRSTTITDPSKVKLTIEPNAGVVVETW